MRSHQSMADGAVCKSTAWGMRCACALFPFIKPEPQHRWRSRHAMLSAHGGGLIAGPDLFKKLSSLLSSLVRSESYWKPFNLVELWTSHNLRCFFYFLGLYESFSRGAFKWAGCQGRLHLCFSAYYWPPLIWTWLGVPEKQAESHSRRLFYCEDRFLKLHSKIVKCRATCPCRASYAWVLNRFPRSRSSRFYKNSHRYKYKPNPIYFPCYSATEYTFHRINERECSLSLIVPPPFSTNTVVLLQITATPSCSTPATAWMWNTRRPFSNEMGRERHS